MLRRGDAAMAAAAVVARSAVAAAGESLAVPAAIGGVFISGSRRLHGSRGRTLAMLMLHPRAARLGLSLAPGGSLDSSSGVTGCGCGRRMSSSACPSTHVVFTAPPEDLEDGRFERPTPLLLVAGEGQPAAWWSGTASFFAARGCTVGTMTLTGRGSSPTETLSLRALQAGVAAAVEKSGLTPPVIVAHSMAGFVCQQYLQSYSASGLVLLDSFPPTPSALAVEHLLLLLQASARAAGDPRHLHHRHLHVLAETPPGLTRLELAQLMKDDPARWEGLLRAYFEEFHRDSPFAAFSTCMRDLGSPEGDHDGSQKEIPSPPGVDVVDGCGDVGLGEEGSSGGRSRRLSRRSAVPGAPRFPVRAFAQMCLGQPSSTLRLESHVVETLVLESGLGLSGDNNADDGDGALKGACGFGGFGGGDLVALNSARRDALEAICEFHGTQGWSPVGRGGCAGPKEVKAESPTPWQELVWDWYDARF